MPVAGTKPTTPGGAINQNWHCCLHIFSLKIHCFEKSSELVRSFINCPVAMPCIIIGILIKHVPIMQCLLTIPKMLKIFIRLK